MLALVTYIQVYLWGMEYEMLSPDMSTFIQSFYTVVSLIFVVGGKKYKFMNT